MAFFIALLLCIIARMEKLSTTELAKQWSDIFKPGFGWVLYRFPGSNSINFAGGNIAELSFNNESVTGFLIAPFFRSEQKFWCIENKLQCELSDSEFSKLAPSLDFSYQDHPTSSSSTKEGYEALVERVLEYIALGKMQKAVPARMKQIDLKPGFSPLNLFRSLSEAYPNAFVYLLSTPQTGTWIGSTPETLARIKNNKLSTLSLAGTRKSGTTNPFTSKENEEQAIVTGYIYDILQRYCTDIELDGPRTISAGNIFHLATYFNGILRSEYQSAHLRIIKELHPTPAVCGMPLHPAREFLLQHENFDRSFYSGFLGPVSPSAADLFVNLRCMQVFPHTALLYAGAGVVPGSVPEKEWLETEEKMNTLQRFL